MTMTETCILLYFYILFVYFVKAVSFDHILSVYMCANVSNTLYLSFKFICKQMMHTVCTIWSSLPLFKFTTVHSELLYKKNSRVFYWLSEVESDIEITSLSLSAVSHL